MKTKIAYVVVHLHLWCGVTFSNAMTSPHLTFGSRVLDFTRKLMYDLHFSCCQSRTSGFWLQLYCCTAGSLSCGLVIIWWTFVGTSRWPACKVWAIVSSSDLNWISVSFVCWFGCFKTMQSGQCERTLWNGTGRLFLEARSNHLSNGLCSRFCFVL